MLFFLLSLLTAIFFIAAFLTGPTVTLTNPFGAYIFFQLHCMLQYFVFFILGFILITLFFLRKYYHHSITYEDIFHAVIQSAETFVISLFLALVGLFCVACIQINIYALLLNFNPAVLGVSTNTKAVLSNLQNNASLQITGSTTQSPVVALVKVSGGQTNFYTSEIVSSFPNFLIIPTKVSSYYLVDNFLIISHLQMSDLQKISPNLAHAFIQQYFSDRRIKSNPQIHLFTQKQFTNLAKVDSQQKIQTITSDIQKMEEAISSSSAAIKNDQAAIIEKQDEINTSMKTRGSQYDACLSTGTYTNGVFTPTFTKAYCQKILDSWDQTLSTQDSQASTLAQKLQQDQQQLKDYQYYHNFFISQKSLAQINTANISDEQGVFQQPQTIKIAVPDSSDHAVRDFLQLLFHEYLHFASYTPGKRFDSTFFEEGLTEYFARSVLLSVTHESINASYPAQVALIHAFSKRIADPDLEAIYFTKDEVALEKELNLAYGDNFYKDNFVYFESLQYTADPIEQTQLVNTILKHMGEKQLSEKDIFSGE